MESCTSRSDRLFGPQVNPDCRAFDFTLYFEDIFFNCLPSSVFLLCLPAAIYRLWARPHVVRASKGVAWKSIALVALFVCQAAFLALRVQSSKASTSASLPGDILQLVSFAAATVFSYMHHYRSIRPSTLLSLYLPTLILLDVARLRTLWLIPTAQQESIVFTLVLGGTLFSFILESSGKERILVTKEGAPKTPEAYSGFWRLMSYSWLKGTFLDGYLRIMTVMDLPEVDSDLSRAAVHEELAITWENADKLKRHMLLYSCFRAYRGSFLAAVVPRLFLSGFNFAQPFLVTATINWVGDDNASNASGKGLIGAFTLVYLGIAGATALYWYRTYRFITKLRAALISLTFYQTTRSRKVDLGEITAITLMGTDVERIVTGFRHIHELWAAPIDMAIAVYLLQRQVFIACIVPAVILLVFVAFASWMSGFSKAAQRTWIEKVEDRLSLTTYMLGDMKSVKMLGLSSMMFTLVQRMREIEITASRKFRQLFCLQVFFANSPAALIPVATFAVYVGIALARHDNSILASQAFTSLSLIALLVGPAMIFLQAIPAVVQCIGSFDRLQEYCNRPQFDESVTDSSSDASYVLPETSEKSDTQGSEKESSSLISFHNQSVSWAKSAPRVLKGINLSLKSNEVTMIIGPVGSGKSTLLESILGEAVVLEGTAIRHFSGAGYCPQTPWLRNQTIRQNIIGASDPDEEWYSTVLHACCLEKDVNQLSLGDRSLVGSKGISLSGGQKQRIALARAVFARHPVVLLDDVFSGMDAATVEHITGYLLGENGLFKVNRTTVVIATHTRYLLQYADSVVALDNGEVIEAGTLDELREQDGYTAAVYMQGAESPVQRDDEQHGSASKPADEAESDALITMLQDVGDDEKRQRGDFSVYNYYVKACGTVPVAIFIFATFLCTICLEISTVWIDQWSKANKESPNKNVGMYLGVYAAFAALATVFQIIGVWYLMIPVISNSALNLHKNLLQSTVGAPLRFFNKTDSGTLTNRFSQDMDLIDMKLPLYAVNYISAVFSCSIKLIILAVYARWLAIAVPFLAAVVYFAQKFYLRTSRQMRLLDIEAKAPLYSIFTDAVNGTTGIRAFGWQAAFEKSCLELLDISQRPVYLLFCIQQCLAFVLDLVVAVMAVILVSTVVALRDSFEPGQVGVALVMVMSFSFELMILIKFWTMLETSVGAVARVKGFTAGTESEERATDTMEVSPTWPASGVIEFVDTVAAYSPEGEAVLKGVSLKIQGGEKVAICGRSGSGKTSLTLALLQLIDLRSGVIKVDDVDLSQIKRSDVRTRINVITQEPFLMPGTIRFNIDPFGAATDDDMVVALQKLRLWDLVKEQGGLDKAMDADSWSIGQRQLLCLARAMVRKSQILVLDEATSSVDAETEVIMQDIISKEFAQQTVIAIMHRLEHITKYDRIALLDKGSLLEFDTPEALLARESGFRDLYRSAGY
ncbi:related to ABC multidrug transporter [Cephalotrichum gorgonifer]|uniref:Related to ABC multidrug transporter n=1 Tax=Cephalotrichum gorgonifer TaxID=2041049 RepID=A0AAE8N2S5_9PEZI|nr:related to ABC multidrug transporter [Cephalotrichum gorgonifer]